MTRIRSANILLVTVKALANEIAKNLVLAGIGSLTIIDHQNVTEEDLGAQFFVAEVQGEQDVIGRNVCTTRATNQPLFHLPYPNKTTACRSRRTPNPQDEPARQAQH